MINKNQSWNILVFGVILLCSLSCRKQAAVEYPEFNPAPVINAFVAADSLIRVHVSVAEKSDTNELKGNDNARVVLYINGTAADTLLPSGGGLYISSVKAEISKTYECRVSLPYFDEARSITTVPAAPVVYGITHIPAAGKDEEGLTYPAVKFTFSNHPDIKMYFEVRIHVLDYGTDRVAEPFNLTDPVLLNEGLPLNLFSNETITDTCYTMVVNHRSGGSNNVYPYVLELRAVSYDYYRFVRQKYLYDAGRFPEFGLGSTQAFSLYSNVVNGYGIFAAFSTVISDTIYPSN